MFEGPTQVARRQSPWICGEHAILHACGPGPTNWTAHTTERVEEALATLHSIERFVCDQHDHASFATAWMFLGKGVAHALDYDFRLVPPAVMAPLQRRLEGLLSCSQRFLEALSLSQHGSGPNSSRALEVWAVRLLG